MVRARPKRKKDRSGGSQDVGGEAQVCAPASRPTRHMPLRLRFAGIVSLLLIVGLVLSGLGALTLLRSYLVQEVDRQLGTYDSGSALSEASSGQNLTRVWREPVEYSVEVFIGGVPRVLIKNRGVKTSSLPKIKVPTAEEAQDQKTQNYTSKARDGSISWRTQLTTVETESGTAVVAVSLPLDDVNRTVTSMLWVVALTSLSITIFGSLAGYLLIERSLRPLKEVERTAAEVAAGDLSQRVPIPSSQTELGELADSLNSMFNQLERAFDDRTESERRMRQFVSDASHELRTPLATIRGYGELYRIGGLTDPEDRSGAMRRIEDEAARMGSLVHDLLQLTRLDEGQPLHRENVDLLAIALDAASDLGALDPNRTVSVTGLEAGCPVPQDPVIFEGDPDRVRQVITNLIGNAHRYTPAGSAVEIGVGYWTNESGEPWAILQVVDHGPGIDTDLADKVFQRFYRLDASRSRDSGGSGLGLAIVASVAQAHGGSARVDPTPGGGATFRVYFPAPSRDA